MPLSQVKIRRSRRMLRSDGQCQSLQFYMPSYNEFPLDGIASTQYQSIINWFNIGQFYFADRKKLHIETITVNGNTLDSFDLAPVFMKLTIQRSELEALKEPVKLFSSIVPSFWSASHGLMWSTI